MKSIILSILFLAVILGQTSQSTAQQSVFTKVYLDENAWITDMRASCITKADNGNYILAGSCNETGMILKIDSAGTPLWAKKPTNNSFAYRFTCLSTTSDSCYVFVAELYEGILCFKANQEGDTIWTSRISFPGTVQARGIIETYDKGFLITGLSFEVNPSDNSYIISIKIDSTGNLVWSNYYMDYTMMDQSGEANSVSQTSDSGFIITGSFNGSLLLLKLSPDGVVEWSAIRNDTIAPSSRGISTLVMPDGYVTLYYLYSYVPNSGYALLKTDFSGNPLWCRLFTSTTYIGFDPQYSSPKLHYQETGHFYFVSDYSAFMNVLYKTDTIGNLELTQGIRLMTVDVLQADDGGYCIAGYGTHGGYDSYGGVIKTDSSGSSVDCTIPAIIEVDTCYSAMDTLLIFGFPIGTWSREPLSFGNLLISGNDGCVENFYINTEEVPEPIEPVIYPNPTSGIINIDLQPETNKKINKIEIFNSSGLQIFMSSDPVFQIDLTPFASGLYLIKIETTGGTFTQRLILEH